MNETNCPRCGGLMEGVILKDPQNDMGPKTARARRCTTCGEIVDPTIIDNRRVLPPPGRPKNHRRIVRMGL